MRIPQSKTIGLIIAFACLLSLGLLSRGVVKAAQVKKDLCHRTGNGSYHMITIPEPAWQTHYNHGDAGPGEAVPGHVGSVFDDACNLVECPCTFTADVLTMDLTFDPDDACLEFNVGFPLEGAIVMTFDDLTFDAFSLTFDEVGGDFSCIVLDSDQNIFEENSGLDEFEAAACVNDIKATAQTLDLPACD